MSIKLTLSSVLRAMVLSIPLALGGCAADATNGDTSGEDVGNDELAGAVGATEQLADEEFDPDFFPPDDEVETIQAETTKAVGIGVVSVTCSSGWPGTRGCYKRIISPTNVVPGSIVVEVDGPNGSMGYSASLHGTREIRFSASIHEGDAFNPGKNTTRFIVAWLRN